ASVSSWLQRSSLPTSSCRLPAVRKSRPAGFVGLHRSVRTGARGDSSDAVGGWSVWPASVACEYGGSRPDSFAAGVVPRRAKRSWAYLFRFVVLVVDVDVPDRILVGSARGDRFHSGLGGQHRVILVVVAVHAVAADEKDVGDRVDVGANAAKLGITPEIRGIGLWHTNDRGLDDVRRVDGVDLFQ